MSICIVNFTIHSDFVGLSMCVQFTPSFFQTFFCLSSPWIFYSWYIYFHSHARCESVVLKKSNKKMTSLQERLSSVQWRMTLATIVVKAKTVPHQGVLKCNKCLCNVSQIFYTITPCQNIYLFLIIRFKAIYFL